MAGKSKRILLNLIIATVINTTLNLIFIPKYGINGAAFSTMVSYILWGVLSLLTARYYIKIIPLKWDMLKITLIAIIPTFILLYVRSIIVLTTGNILIIGFLFFIFYFGVIILTKCLDKNDLMILQAIKNKILKK